MADIINLDSDSDRTIISDDSSPTLTLENQSTGVALKVVASGSGKAGFATIAPFRSINSAASGPMMEFVGKGVVSTASGSPTVAFAIRVKYGNTYGWITALHTVA